MTGGGKPTDMKAAADLRSNPYGGVKKRKRKKALSSSSSMSSLSLSVSSASAPLLPDHRGLWEVLDFVDKQDENSKMRVRKHY